MVIVLNPQASINKPNLAGPLNCLHFLEFIHVPVRSNPNHASDAPGEVQDGRPRKNQADQSIQRKKGNVDVAIIAGTDE